MGKKMKLAVILVNYNGMKYNDKCLESIFRSSWDGQLSVYLIDNGSTDGSIESLQDKWGSKKEVHFFFMTENRGFSAGNNFGIQQALQDGAEAVLLLNNDTYICDNMIAELADAQKRYGGDCITVPKICYYDQPNIIWSAGGGFTRIVKKPVNYGENQLDTELFAQEKQCENGTGCCLLIPRSVIEKIGFLDEAFFLYYEDTEFFLRAGEKGVKIYYIPTAKMYHKVNGSTKGNENPACIYYITRNWLICHRRHLHGVRYWIFFLYFLANRAAWTGIWFAKGGREQILAVWRGIYDFMTGKSGKGSY